MAGSSRIGAVILVTLLSCLVLGGVWGLLLYFLPQSDLAPEPVPASAPASPVSSRPPDNPPAERGPVLLPPPPVATREAPPAIQEPSRSSVSEAAGLPAGILVKCDLEMHALCPDGEGERRACLQRKAAQLSQPCRPLLRDKLARLKEQWQQLQVACETDRRQFCREVPSASGGLLLQCLESHAQHVSDQCFQYLPKRGRLLN